MEATRILMLEDEDNDEELIRRELRRLTPAPEIRRVTSEPAFLAALSEFSPDIVLCDHNVPSFGGRIALAALRRVAPDTPFILVTGSLDEETAVSYLKAGAADYILKDRLGPVGPPRPGWVTPARPP